VSGFFYPPNNAGDDRRPHTAFQTLVPVSNDVLQYYFGVTARTNDSGYGRSNRNAGPINPIAGGIFDGMGPITVDTASGNDPNEDVNRINLPRAKSLTRLRSRTRTRPTGRRRRRAIRSRSRSTRSTSAAT
jgi:hypothetical protein